MPFCPECRAEYQDWAKVFADCGTDLVSNLAITPSRSKAAKLNGEPLKLVTTAPNEPMAKMWAEILENEGIHSLTKSRDLMASMYMPSLLSSCEIYVLSSQSEKAKEILNSLTDDSMGDKTD